MTGMSYQEIAITVALFAMPKCDEEMHPLQSRLMLISNLENESTDFCDLTNIYHRINL